MLMFYCTDCKKKINCPDNEAVDEAFIRLDEHIEKCPLARFTFEGTTKASQRTADTIQSVMANEEIVAKLQTSGAILPIKPLKINQSTKSDPPNRFQTGRIKRMIAFED